MGIGLVRGEGLIQPLGSGIAEAHRDRDCGVYIERWGMTIYFDIAVSWLLCLLFYRI